MKVAIPGGTGLIGRALSRALASRGHEPIALTRRPDRTPAAPPFAGVRRWDPFAGPAAPNPFEGVDAIVNLAGEPIAGGRWSSARKERIYRTRVWGTRKIVEAVGALEQKPRILIAGSAVGFYGSRGDAQLRENEPGGEDFLAGVCRDLEHEADAANALGLRVVAVRTSPVLSAKGGVLERMIGPFRMGVGGRIGSGRQWFPWIHVTDIADLIVFCIETEAVAGPVNAVSPGIVTNAGFTGALASALGRKAPLVIPPLALRLLYGEMALVLLSSIRAVPEKAIGHGFRFRYRSVDEALTDCLHL